MIEIADFIAIQRCCRVFVDFLFQEIEGVLMQFCGGLLITC